MIHAAAKTQDLTYPICNLVVQVVGIVYWANATSRFQQPALNVSKCNFTSNVAGHQGEVDYKGTRLSINLVTGLMKVQIIEQTATSQHISKQANEA